MLVIIAAYTCVAALCGRGRGLILQSAEIVAELRKAATQRDQTHIRIINLILLLRHALAQLADLLLAGPEIVIERGVHIAHAADIRLHVSNLLAQLLVERAELLQPLSIRSIIAAAAGGESSQSAESKNAGGS